MEPTRQGQKKLDRLFKLDFYKKQRLWNNTHSSRKDAANITSNTLDSTNAITPSVPAKPINVADDASTSRTQIDLNGIHQQSLGNLQRPSVSERLELYVKLSREYTMLHPEEISLNDDINEESNESDQFDHGDINPEITELIWCTELLNQLNLIPHIDHGETDPFTTGLDQIETDTATTGLDQVETDTVTTGLDQVETDLVTTGLDQVETDPVTTEFDQVVTGPVTTGVDEVETDPVITGLDQVETDLVTTRLDQVETDPVTTGLDQVETDPVTIGLDQVETDPATTGLDQVETDPVTTGLDQVETGPVTTGLDQIETDPVTTGLDQVETGPVTTGLDQIETDPVITGLDQVETDPATTRFIWSDIWEKTDHEDSNEIIIELKLLTINSKTDHDDIDQTSIELDKVNINDNIEHTDHNQTYQNITQPTLDLDNNEDEEVSSDLDMSLIETHSQESISYGRQLYYNSEYYQETRGQTLPSEQYDDTSSAMTCQSSHAQNTSFMPAHRRTPQEEDKGSTEESQFPSRRGSRTRTDRRHRSKSA